MERYELGESVVNKNNMKMGKIVDAVDSDNGETEAVKLQYEDGSFGWAFSDKISRMLYETDPVPDSTNLNE